MGEYMKKIGMRRILIMLLGNVFLGMGVSIFKFAGLGNDAYNAMMMALSDVVGIPYARFFAIFSVGLFVIELIAGRHFIGLGTIINTLFLGYYMGFHIYKTRCTSDPDSGYGDRGYHLQSGRIHVPAPGCGSVAI